MAPLSRKLFCLFAILFIFCTITFTVHAGDQTVFAPGDFEISRWRIHISHEKFRLDDRGEGLIVITKNNSNGKCRGFVHLNGTHIRLREFFRSKAQVVERKVNLRQRNRMTVLLWGSKGTAITVEVKKETATPPTPPPEIAFSVTPPSTTNGNSCELQWTTLNANTCTIEPGIGGVSLNGSKVIRPTETTTYTLTATGNGGAAAASVMVEVANAAPVANAQVVTTNEDTSVGITLTGSDVEGGPLSYHVVAGPSHGELSGTAPNLLYTPTTDYHGQDTFTFKVNDGTIDSNTAAVSITVNSVNDAPVASNDAYNTNEDMPLTVPAPGVLTGDNDIDGNHLTVALETKPLNGTLALNPDGSFTYTPTLNYNGPDSFTYHANDGTADSNIATVTIIVSAVNDAPVATNDAYNTNEDMPLTVPAPGVLTGDNDIDGNHLTVALETGPPNGILALNPNGSFTYTPSPNYNGADSFTYKAYDGQTYSNVATVNITVNAVNDPPIIESITENTTGVTGGTVTITVNGTDDNDVIGLTIYFRKIGEAEYTIMAMAENPGSIFSYNIPIDPNDETDLQYYVRVTDNQGVSSDSSVYTITVEDTDPPSFTDNSPAGGTTGDSYTFDVAASDNIGVISVKVTWYHGGLRGSEAPMAYDGDGTYSLTITLDESVDNLTYTITVSDEAENTAMGGEQSVGVADNDLPEITNATGDTTGTTGDITRIEASLTDNIGIVSAKLYYLPIGGGDYTEVEFAAGTADVPVADAVGDILYYIVVRDAANNEVREPATSTYTITVQDNDPPSITNDRGNVSVTTGEMATLWVTATDNIGVTGGKVFLDGDATGVDLDYNGTLGRWEYEYSAPSNDVSDHTYSLSVYDVAGNRVTSGTYNIDVSDNDPPSLIDSSPAGGTTGDPYIFDVSASDNIGVTSVTVAWSYGGVNGGNVPLADDGDGTYSLTITLDESVDNLTYTITVSDEAENTAMGGEQSVEVADNDLPEITNATGDTTGTTGDITRIEATLADNIGITFAKLYYLPIGAADYTEVEFASGTADVPVADAVGDILYYIVVRDAANNEVREPATSTYTITVQDNDPPSISQDSGNVSVTTGEIATLWITATDNIGVTDVKVFLDGDPTGVALNHNTGNGRWEYGYQAPSDDVGDHTYSLSVYDAAGNVVTSGLYNIAVSDNDVPLITGDSGNVSVTTGEIATLWITATDNIGVTDVKVFVDGDPTGVALNYNTGNGRWEYDYQAPSDDVSDHAYRLSVYDAAGNLVTSGPYNIAVSDNDPPSITLDSGNVSVTTGEIATLWITATDNIGVTDVKVFLDGDPTGVALNYNTGNGRWEYDYQAPSDDLSDHTYRLSVYDAAGNLVTSGPYNITVQDNDPPSISQDSGSVSVTTGEIATLWVSATDNIGVAGAKVFVDGDTTGVDLIHDESNGLWGYDYQAPSDDVSDHTYNLSVYDAAGNLVTSGTYNIDVIDNDPPSLTDNSPAGGTTGDPYTFDVSCFDNIGVANVTVTWSHGGLIGSEEPLADDVNGRYSLTITLDESVDNLTYTITVKDQANNNAPVASQSVAVADNDPPEAVDDNYSVEEDGVLTVSVPGILGNDSDNVANVGNLTSILVDPVSNGTLTFGSDGSFTYTPTSDFNGTDSFTYKANDGANDSNIAEMTITVLPVTDIPENVDYGMVEDEQQGGGGLVGENISILNGNVVEKREDLRFPSPNRLGLSFQPTYNSKSNIIGSLGHGWTHTYEASLDPSFDIEGDSFIRIMDRTGKGHYFQEYVPGTFKGAFKDRSFVKSEGPGYIWYQLDGSRYGFSVAGKLAWIEDEKGNRLEVGYNAQDQLLTVTDAASGRILEFYYNSDGRLDHILGPVTPAVTDGKWVRYGYDANQNLTSVTHADNSGFDYIYGDPNDMNNLTEKRNKLDHLLNTWSYDSDDRAMNNSSAHGKGVVIQYVNETEVDVTDAYGTLRTYFLDEVDGRKRVTGMQGIASAPYSDSNAVRWAYDDEMRLIEVEYAGGTINQYLNYDDRGNPGTVKLAAGNPEERVITFTYHPEMNVPLIKTEASVLGSGNKVTIWDYAAGSTRLLSRIVEKGFTRDLSEAVVPYEYITQFSYNSKGQLLSSDGPLPGFGDTTSYTYHATTGDLLSITRPLNLITSFSQYDDAGQVGYVTDVNGQSKSFSYDGRGRITAITHHADGSTSNMTYNVAGLLDTTTDEDVITRNYDYDTENDTDYGRLVRITDADGNYIAYKYDGQGNRIEMSKHEADGTRTYLKTWSYQHPYVPGRLWRETLTDRPSTVYDYDDEGKIISVTDPEGHMIEYDYDPLNRLSMVIQPGDVRTTNTYDGHGNLSSVTDGKGHETTYEYDDMGRLVITTSPDTGTIGYSYDWTGNLVRKADAKGVTTQYTYDVLNRLTATQFPDPSDNMTYAYDAGTNGMGRLTGITDPSGTLTYGYDSRGRLTQKTSRINGIDYAVSYVYSPGSRLGSVTYPSGRTIDITRDTLGRMKGASTTFGMNTTTLVSNMSYRAFGGPSGMQSGTGSSVQNESDECDCVNISNPGSEKERVYEYDMNGNLTKVIGTNTPWYNQDFVYDSLNRLASATGRFGSINYTYDKVGNRKTREVGGQTETYSYLIDDLIPTNKLEEIAGPDPVSFTHDANGNTTGIGNRVLIYNQNNQLIQVKENGNVLGKYTYNGLGQRVMKEVDGVTTLFHYDLGGKLIAESQADGTFTSEYLYMGKVRLAKVDVSDNNAIYYYLNDRLGTPQLMTDAGGIVVWEATYKPFGEAEVNPNSNVVNNFRFPGQYYDSETGLHYNYHRYYDPRIGRYLTPDPIGLLGGINLFTYALNNPTNLIDSMGLDTLEKGANFSLSALGWGGNFTITAARDDKGDQGFVFSFSGGGYGELLGISAQAVRGTTNASSINDLYGTSSKVGGGVNPFFLIGTYEKVIAENYRGDYWAGGLGVGFVPVEFYGMVTKTYVINLDDLFEIFLNKFFGVPVPDDNLYKDESNECE